MKQRGFILPSPMILYGAAGALLIILSLSVALKVQSSRLDAVKAEYATFAAGVEAVGKLAVAETKRKIAEDQLNKEKADHENITNRIKLGELAERLRNERANPNRGLLPTPTANSLNSSRACFDRPALDRALSAFVEGVAGLVSEGGQGVADLNTAKVWAGNIKAKE